jgi:phosphate:Na+ symporter
MNTGAAAWAGLGLFLVGIRLLTNHLKQLTNGPIRAALTRTLTRTGATELIGLVSGALSQSTSAVTFLATGLLCGGALTLAKALPMLAWANVGTSALVLLAAVDVRGIVLLLLGAVGLASLTSTDQAEQQRQILYATLGLGLLLFGLAMVKDSALAAQTNPWLIEFFEFSASADAVTFLVGFVLAIAMQSSAVVTVLVLPLVTSGLIAFDQVVMLIYGASAGSGTAVLLLASTSEGSARQLALCQAIVRMVTAALLVALLLTETHLHVPLIIALVKQIAHSLAMQTSLVYLLFQMTFAGFTLLFLNTLIRIIQHLSPPSHEEALSKPMYLFDGAAEDASTSVALAKLEYHRLLRGLPYYLDDLRTERDPRAIYLPIDTRHEASVNLAAQIDEFLDKTLHQNSGMDAEPVFVARMQLGALTNLQTALYELHAELTQLPHGEESDFKNQLVEGLHALLSFAGDAVAEDSADGYDMLLMLASDRSDLMERVRNKLLSGSLTLQGRDTLLSAILIFERIVWLLRRLAPAASSAPAMTEATA